NFFALGLISWMYTRPTEPTLEWIKERFAKNELVMNANLLAFKAGYNFGETAELFESAYEVKPATHLPGVYTNVTGNTAMAWGLVAAGQLAKLPVFLASYPITPASDILHELSKHKNFGVRTMQAEDEIAAAGAIVGAAFGGHPGVTTTSGPGVALKYRTPVLLLSDGYLANSSEPWRLPDVESLPAIDVPFASEPNHDGPEGTRLFCPYERDPDTLARPWAVPGTPGLEHRIGGL